MELLNSLSTGGAGATDNLVLANWREGMQAQCLRLRLHMPVVVGTAGTPTLTDVKNLLAYFLGSFTLRYGPSQDLIAYNAVPGNEVLSVYRYIFQDVPWNDWVGVAQTTGAKTFNLELAVPFDMPGFDGLQRRPGWTQGRTIRLEVVEGVTALTAGALALTRGAGNATIDVIPDYIPGSDDWAPILTYARINSPRLDAVGPAGTCVGAWDDNAAQSATVITKFRLYLGTAEINSNVVPSNVWSRWESYVDQGGSDVSDTVTLLYVVDPWANIDEIPSGAVTFLLNNQDIATIHLRVLMYPDLTDSQADGATEFASRVKGQPVNASTKDPETKSPDKGSASHRPMTFHTSDSSAFYTRSGLVGAGGGKAPQTYVSPNDAHSAATAIGAAHSIGAGSQAAGAATGKMLSRIPGGITSEGKGRASRHSAVKGVTGGIARKLKAK